MAHDGCPGQALPRIESVLHSRGILTRLSGIATRETALVGRRGSAAVTGPNRPQSLVQNDSPTASCTSSFGISAGHQRFGCTSNVV